MTCREFSDTYLPLSERLYRVALHLLEDEKDAEDAVQDLYLKLWNRLDVLEGVNNPEAYAITLLRNNCLDRLRAAQRKPLTALSEDIADSVNPDSRADSREALARMAKALEGLSEGQRTVFRMRILEDLSYEEITEATGMNGLTLRVLLSQARAKLKKVL